MIKSLAILIYNHLVVKPLPVELKIIVSAGAALALSLIETTMPIIRWGAALIGFLYAGATFFDYILTKWPKWVKRIRAIRRMIRACKRKKNEGT